MGLIDRSMGVTPPARPPGGPSGEPRAAREPLSLLGLVLAFVSAAGLTMCIALVYLGMQPIMDVGGFVAAGGPYEIAHPAPEWVMLIPLSIWGVFIFGGLNLWTTRRNWSLGLIPLAWVGLFGSLGWNFVRNGLSPPGGEGLAWGWLLSGAVFWAMALVPALFIARWFVAAFTNVLRGERQPIPAPRGFVSAGQARAPYIVMQALGIAVGVGAAIALFGAVAG